MNAIRFRGRLQSVALLFAYCLFAGSHFALCDEAETTPTTEIAGFPEPPKLVLAPSRAVEGERNPAEYWGERVGALIDAANKSENPVEKCRRLLAATNIILGRQLEPVSSRAVLDLSLGSDAEERTSIGANLDRAESLIGQAKKLLLAQPPTVEPAADALPPPQDDNVKPEVDQLLHSAEILQSFLVGQREFLLEETTPGSRRRAASGLAPLLEDPDRNVAAAARLWQALLRGLESDPAAALQILNAPMAKPQPDTWPYGLFSRVLRCRYQAVQGSWSSALVMLSYIEEQLEEWVSELAMRGDARRFFAYIRLETLRRWYESLPSESVAEKAWCAQRAREVLQSYFSVETSLLRLEPAVPMIFSDKVYQVDANKSDPQ